MAEEARTKHSESEIDVIGLALDMKRSKSSKSPPQIKKTGSVPGKFFGLAARQTLIKSPPKRAGLPPKRPQSTAKLVEGDSTSISFPSFTANEHHQSPMVVNSKTMEILMLEHETPKSMSRKRKEQF